MSGLSTKLRYLSLVALISVAYFITGKMGLSLPYFGSSVTLVWAPTGISLAVLLRWGTRYWPGVFFGALLVNLSVGSTPLVAGGIAIGNTLESFAAALILTKITKFEREFNRLRDTLAFITIGVIGCTMISATIGASSLYAGGIASWSCFGSVWLTW